MSQDLIDGYGGRTGHCTRRKSRVGDITYRSKKTMCLRAYIRRKALATIAARMHFSMTF